jgi:hypothetical protein
MNILCKALLLTCAGTSLSMAAVEGEKWKISSSMQMSGMTMPAMSNEICKQPGDDSVPMKTEKDCTIYDNKRVGNVQSFKMRCTGKEAVEGSAEFTYLGPDHYKGKMIVNTQGQTMTMNMEGQKIGSCDGGEINLKAKEMQAQAQQQMAQSEKAMAETCRKFALEGINVQMMQNQCKDPADRQTFCNSFNTHDKFLMAADVEKQAGSNNNYPGSRPLSEASAMCGFPIEGTRAQLCSTAEQAGKLKFIISQCPVQGQQMAAAHCAGRRYTAIAEQYRDFCSNYASNEAQQAENTPAGKAKGIFSKGKKALGGLLGN